MNLPVQEEEEQGRGKRQSPEYAIQLALESKWEEAAAVNRAILQANPEDVDALNRLGKALLELGRFRDSRGAYSKSLELDPVNTIAKRNLERLAALGDTEQVRPAAATAKVAQDLFIEEMGKSGVSALHDTPQEALAKLVAGDEVYLKPDGNLLRVENSAGEYLGIVEPKLGLRLARMIEGGNRYAAAVKSISERAAQLIIKETYRDPSQTKLSFPATGTESVRPYIKDSLLRYAIDDEEEEEESEEADNEEWEGETEAQEGISLSSFKEQIEDIDSDDEEEE